MTGPIITRLRPEECRPVPGAGLGALGTERGNLPLESVTVTARVTGLIAGVTVVQGYRNPHDVPLEATYVFPLPPRAAVTAFRMEADDRVIEGVLQERGRARAAYERALAEGRPAAIAEEDRPDVFTIRVGNIMPGERVTVRLELSQPLPYEDGAAEFRFPLVVAPRYIPGSPLGAPAAGSGVVPDTDAVPDASRITPPVLLPGFPAPVRLSFTVTLDPAGLELREIRSSLHDVAVEGDTIRLRPGERLDRDVILRFAYRASGGLLLVPDEPGDGAAEDGEGTLMLTVLPPDDREAARRPRDVVLVLDRSGSMAGWKMVAARRAAARIVDTLTERDRLAVLAFDNVIERAFPDGLTAATDRARYRAVEFLARLEARGGTEMLAPLEEALTALAAAAEGGRDAVLVLVTDGQVGDEDRILERMASRIGGVRVHAVGIDRAVNAAFLGRLAVLGAGRCELVESEDRLDEAMEHIHRRIGAPLVTDITARPDGLEVIPGTLTHLGSLYPGVPLTLLGRYRGRPTGALTLAGRTASGEPWETRVTGRAAANPAARAIWVRAHLRELEDRYAAGDTSLEERIVATSLRFGVLCRFTAFAAIDTRVTADGAPEHRVIQPVEPPSGWEMTELATGAPMMATLASFGGAPPPPGAPAGSFGAMLRRAGRFAAGPHLSSPAAGTAPAVGFDTVRPLLIQELARLREAQPLPGPELRRYLADLASRLRVIAHMLGGHAELTALADELARAELPGAEPGDLCRRAIDLLIALTGGPGTGGGAETGGHGAGGGPGGAAGPGRAFWRRRP
ncbi:Vault protein inter-alpha-trypsin domain protein [Thermobispora bispora DSM 43833]|uniref:Vault protein inter-alpha-trypsin domain protein n=1 Tax=Thermobispora bispora (strain ATCC 19993 / DSM 43833 / CBS 139.67 / JCM 10125 / KCTC 9307 / NBRC 14880 / R51) TaxID=469371 RepID=D6Y9B6_THEBD|nr:Vault protein inter-alpha-trypsin domain protein [Thermobispora bispora DSM 43833]